MNTELLEPRMLLSSVVGVDISDVSAADPLVAGSADQWVPYVPSPDQTKMQAQSVADLTAVKVAICFDSPGYQVADWGIVKRDGNLFYVDAQVEQWTGPIIQSIQPTTLEHPYDLGKLDPNAKYHFTFQAWGKEVETLFFSVNVQVPVVWIVAKPAEIPEPIFGSLRPLVPSTVTVTRTEPSINNLDVVLKLGGSATPLKDYSFDTGWQETAPDVVQVRIPAGQTSTSFFVVPLADDLAEGNETVVLALVPGDAYKVGAPDAAKITILDAQAQWIPYVPTADQTSIALRTEADVTQAKVSLHLWNMRFRVTDWGQVQQDGNQFIVDSNVEQYVGPMPMIPEPVDPPPIIHDYALGILKPGSYSFVFEAWGKAVEQQPFTVPIPVELPVVAIKATDPLATEPDPRRMGPMPSPWDPGTFTVVRTGPVDRSLMVTLKFSGTATDGLDYHFEPQYPVYTFAPLPPGEFLAFFPEGVSSSTIDVIPHGDNLVEGDETVVMAIVDGAGYDVGTPDAAKVVIQDSTVDQWIPYVPTAEQTELAVSTIQGLSIAGVTLRFGSPGFEVRDWGMVERNGTEFVVDTKIEQWTGPVIMIVPPPVSQKYELGGLVPGEYTFTFKAWGKTVESLVFKVGSSAPAVSVVAADSIATEPIRGGPQPRLGLFKVVRVGPADSDLLIHLKVSGTAKHGEDYLFGAFDMGPFTDEISVMMPAGHSWVPIPVLARADAEVEGIETVVLTVAPAGTYDVGANASDTVRILDTRSPILRVRDPNGGPEKDLPVALPDGSGKLDLEDNQLIVQLPEGEDMGSILSHVADLVRIGRNGGSWTGGGITSSAAARNPLTGLAIVPEEQANQIRVQRTYYGDANLDGVVNADDYFQTDSGFISQKPGWYNGDFNYDGVINADDYFLIDSAFVGQSGPLAATTMPISPELISPAVAQDVGTTPQAKAQESDPILSQLFSSRPVLQE